MCFPLTVVVRAAEPKRAKPLESMPSDRDSHSAGLAYLPSLEESEMNDARREGPGRF